MRRLRGLYGQVAGAVRVADTGPRLVSLEPGSLAEVLGTLSTVGALTGRSAEAAVALADAERRLAAVARAVAGRSRPRVVVLEWLDPVWPVGHWGAGPGRRGRRHRGARRRRSAHRPGGLGGRGRRGAGGARARAVRVPAQRTLAELPALTARPGWSALPAVRSGRVWVVDGPAYLNRPGPRVVRGVEVLAHLLHGIGTVAPGEAVSVVPPL